MVLPLNMQACDACIGKGGIGHIKWKRENKCWTFKDNTPKVKLYESFYQAMLQSIGLDKPT